MYIRPCLTARKPWKISQCQKRCSPSHVLQCRQDLKVIIFYLQWLCQSSRSLICLRCLNCWQPQHSFRSFSVSDIQNPCFIGLHLLMIVDTSIGFALCLLSLQSAEEFTFRLSIIMLIHRSTSLPSSKVFSIAAWLASSMPHWHVSALHDAQCPLCCRTLVILQKRWFIACKTASLTIWTLSLRLLVYGRLLKKSTSCVTPKR